MKTFEKIIKKEFKKKTRRKTQEVETKFKGRHKKNTTYHLPLTPYHLPPTTFLLTPATNHNKSIIQYLIFSYPLERLDDLYIPHGGGGGGQKDKQTHNQTYIVTYRLNQLMGPKSENV